MKDKNGVTRDRIPENGTAVVTVRCVQCAELIDLGPFTARELDTLSMLADMMVSSTICNGCIGRLADDVPSGRPELVDLAVYCEDCHFIGSVIPRDPADLPTCAYGDTPIFVTPDEAEEIRDRLHEEGYL